MPMTTNCQLPKTAAAPPWPVVRHRATHEIPPIVHEVLREPGQPLDVLTRTFFEPLFGADFSGVRVHTGTSATQSVRVLSARAFTSGQHVVFDANRYQPHTYQGRRLLAHELAHTIQQRQTAYTDSIPRRIGDGAGDVFEYQADRTAERVMGGQGADLDASTPQVGVIQRQPELGGPYHPPAGVELRCDALDDCSILSTKINYLKHTIQKHAEWDVLHPDPNYPAGRHTGEIENLQRALDRCIGFHSQKCRGQPTFIPAPETSKEPEKKPAIDRQRVTQFCQEYGIPIILVGAILAALAYALASPEPFSKALAALTALLGSAAVAALILIKIGFNRPSGGGPPVA